MTLHSLRFRLIAVASAVLLIALALSGVGLYRVFERTIRQDAVAAIDEDLRLILARVALGPADDLVLVAPPPDPRFAEPGSGYYWQISRAGRDRLGSLSLIGQRLSLPTEGDPLAAAITADMAGPAGERLLVRFRSLILAGGSGDQRVDVAVGLALSGLDDVRWRYVDALVAVLGLLAAVFLSAVAIVAHTGLKPLRRLRRQLRSLHEGTATQLDGRFPDEIVPLVEDLNQLLARRAGDVARAAVRAGDLAHGLKTPLAALAATARDAEDCGQPSLAAAIREEAGHMEAIVRRELARARAHANALHGQARVSLDEVAARSVRAMQRIHAARSLAITTDLPALVVAVDETDAYEIIGNLVDNACKWARRTVSVRLSRRAGLAILVIGDDGPGIAADAAAAMGARGRRLDETVAGSGFGLAIVEDLVAGYGGSLRFGTASAGGLEVEVGLPLSPQPLP